MPIVILDDSLKYDPMNDYLYKHDSDYLLKKVVKPENSPKWDWKTNTYSIPKEIVLRHNIPDANLFHANYMEYLTQCYAIHLGIEITPDTFWYQVLSEIAQQVKETPEIFRDLFTDSDEKKEITVQTNQIDHLPLEQIIEQLKKLVPMDTESFFPKFSTTSQECFFAYQAAFAEACSPFYSYSTCLCGYPKIRIRGGKEDYDSLKDHLSKISFIFRGRGEITNYISKVQNCLGAFRSAFQSGNIDYLSKILTTKSCGSGGEIECDGWWTKNMYVKDMSRQRPENFPSGISRVEYKNLETQRNFSLNVGLFYSKVDSDEIAVPDWAIAVTEIRE